MATVTIDETVLNVMGSGNGNDIDNGNGDSSGSLFERYHSGGYKQFRSATPAQPLVSQI